MEVQPCALGDAYVRFSSPLEREQFLDKVFQFGPHYSLRFIKHDEAENARAHDLDREAWVMIMGFHLDARNNKAIEKAHETNYRSRIVVKVLLNDDVMIPHDVVVIVGSETRICSWTCPVFALKRSNRTMLGDEDQVLPDGLLHPLPMPPPALVGF
ncbi:hypothetical protein HU200_053588 [Digitaria exilis]|uniref:Uncharacterized protein n=1 Tax=Digitaria exilis TaxID=1010633 RepID=A0A835ARI9_9POAL|nr:hypothetical protein HU200_053588 [Digitaria exilis]